MKINKLLSILFLVISAYSIGNSQIVVTFENPDPAPPVDCFDTWTENSVPLQMVEVMGGGSCFFDYSGGNLNLFPSGFEAELAALPDIASVLIRLTDFCGNGCTSGEISSNGSPVFTFANSVIGTEEVFVFDNVNNMPLDILFIQSFEGFVSEIVIELNDIVICIDDIDSDGDGVCDFDDCAPNDGEIYPGAPCDDGDPCTQDDVYEFGELGCECFGILVDEVCLNECELSEGELIGTPCDDGDNCTVGDTWDEECQCIGTYLDSDEDGICDDEDICPELDDNLLGMPCDDGNPCTFLDTWDVEFCACIGVSIEIPSDEENVKPNGDSQVMKEEDPCNECILSDGELIGLPCEDFDPCTEGETWDENCECTGGIEMDSDEDGVCDFFDQCPEFDDNLIGTSCDDGNDCTVGETYNNDCQCGGGEEIDMDNDGFCGESDPDDNNPCVPDDSDEMCQPIIECFVIEDIDFEMGYGSWIDGGSDAAVAAFATYANSGVNCARLRDNSSSSVLTSPSYDLSDAVETTIEFTYITESFDNAAEDFFLEQSTDGGLTFTMVEEWNLDDEFVNGVREFTSSSVLGPISSDTKFRFRCDASSNGDLVYIDDVTITTCIEIPAPTCNDGIQNGDETGVDCGGSCSSCPEIICDDSIELTDFESGWEIWNDGGSDARRSSLDAAFANSGDRCVRLRDNTSTSVITTDDMDYSDVALIELSFTYITSSFDNSSEDFWLQVSTDGGATFTTVEEWNLGDEFENDVREFEFVEIPGPFSENTQLRFRCDASANGDKVYLDDIAIGTCVEGVPSANIYFQATNFDEDVISYYNSIIDADIEFGALTDAALADRNFVFLALPESTLSASEKSALSNFLSGGGRVIAIGCPCIGGSIPVINDYLTSAGSSMSLDSETYFSGCQVLTGLTETDNSIANGVTTLGAGCITTVNAGAGDVRMSNATGDLISMEAVGGGEIVLLGDVNYLFQCVNDDNLPLAYGLINQPIPVTSSIAGDIVDYSFETQIETEIENRDLDISKVNIVNLYPNPIPVNGEITIEVENQNNIIGYEVLDMKGSILKSGTWNHDSNTLRLEVDGLSLGNYVLKLNTKSGIETKKFMIL